MISPGKFGLIAILLMAPGAVHARPAQNLCEVANIGKLTPSQFRSLLPASMSCRDRQFGLTALGLTAISGTDWEVQTLVRAGADINEKDRSGRTALMWLAYMGGPGQLDEFLKLGANPNVRDPNGVSLLMLATANPNPATLSAILDLKPDLEARDNMGNTALLDAAGADGDAALKMLLTSGVDITKKNNRGQTALMIGARMDPSRITLLIAYGADARAHDDAGKNVLMYQAASFSSQPEKAAQYWMGLLVQAGVGLNDRDNAGQTALMYAAKSGDKGEAEALLALGANAGLRDGKGRTAFDDAMLRKTFQGTALLSRLKAGAGE